MMQTHAAASAATSSSTVSEHRGALAWANTQVAAARDDPAVRLALMERLFHGPTGRAPRHLPFRRAALSFMRWQAQRGLLNPLDASPSGSVWWRAMNERLLRDGCESIALLGGLRGVPSSHAVRLWLQFASTPTPSCWYRAHNARIVGGYLEHEGHAEEETAPERFFMNARWCASSTRTLSLPLRASRWGGSGRARFLGDPRLGMVGAFLSLRRVIPNHYPLTRDVEWYIADEQRLGRVFDYAVIAPRLERLYEWSAEEIGESRLLEADPRRQSDLCVAVRATTCVACTGLAIPGPGYWNASRRLAEAAAAPKAGQLFLQVEHRQFL